MRKTRLGPLGGVYGPMLSQCHRGNLGTKGSDTGPPRAGFLSSGAGLIGREPGTAGYMVATWQHQRKSPPSY